MIRSRLQNKSMYYFLLRRIRMQVKVAKYAWRYAETETIIFTFFSPPTVRWSLLVVRGSAQLEPNNQCQTI